MSQEVDEASFLPGLSGEIDLLRDAPAVDLRRGEAVLRAAEPGPHENDVHGITVRDPPPLHAQGAGVRSARVAPGAQPPLPASQLRSRRQRAPSLRAPPPRGRTSS